MCFCDSSALIPIGMVERCATWRSEIIDASMHDVGLHRFEIEAVLEVVQLCSDANAAQNSGIVGSKSESGIGL